MRRRYTNATTWRRRLFRYFAHGLRRSSLCFFLGIFFFLQVLLVFHCGHFLFSLLSSLNTGNLDSSLVFPLYLLLLVFMLHYHSFFFLFLVLRASLLMHMEGR